MMPIINIYNMACIVQAEKKENFWRQRKEGMTEEREDSPVQVGWLALEPQSHRLAGDYDGVRCEV